MLALDGYLDNVTLAGLAGDRLVKHNRRRVTWTSRISCKTGRHLYQRVSVKKATLRENGNVCVERVLQAVQVQSSQHYVRVCLKSNRIGRAAAVAPATAKGFKSLNHFKTVD